LFISFLLSLRKCKFFPSTSVAAPDRSSASFLHCFSHF
jgi:hypothetical protein